MTAAKIWTINILCKFLTSQTAKIHVEQHIFNTCSGHSEKSSEDKFRILIGSKDTTK